jgi:RNA-directed DNA polymerase
MLCPEYRRTAAPGLTGALASDDVLEAAFAWVCQRRLSWSPDADI